MMSSYCVPRTHLLDECDHLTRRINATVKTLSEGGFDYTRCTKILNRIDVAADALNDEWEYVQILLFIYSLVRTYQTGIRLFILDDGGFGGPVGMVVLALIFSGAVFDLFNTTFPAARVTDAW
jgi:hypothetical protein